MQQPLAEKGMVAYFEARTSPIQIGVGGQPRARPFFFGSGENEIRHPTYLCANPLCCPLLYQPGPNIPDHWLDGGQGWVTRYFTDIEPFSWENKKNGKHRCQVPGCQYQIENDGCCNDSMCWCPYATAASKMQEHATTAHGAQPPPVRQWATDLFNTEGCLDVLCCAPCQGSRQVMALAGHANTSNIWWTLIFCLWGFRRHDRYVYWVPPHFLVALFTRHRMVTLNNIDEGCCTTWMHVTCCACCSIAQTYRELTASGVWPGGVCNSVPPVVMLKAPGVMA
eukprot:PhF_6_TR6820/c0_g1_i1/m.9810